MGARMEQGEMCYLCDRPGMPRELGIWFVNGTRRPVHTQCWIDAYRAGRLAPDGNRLRT